MNQMNPEVYERDHVRPYFEAIAKRSAEISGIKITLDLVESGTGKSGKGLHLSFSTDYPDGATTEEIELISRKVKKAMDQAMDEIDAPRPDRIEIESVEDDDEI